MTGSPLDPRVQRLVSKDPALQPIAQMFERHVLDEREALIQMLIALARENQRLSHELHALSELQPATLPMGRQER